MTERKKTSRASKSRSPPPLAQGLYLPLVLDPGGGGTPYIGLYGEAPPERGTFFRLQVYKRVGISQVEVYKRVGKSVVSQREVNK